MQTIYYNEPSIIYVTGEKLTACTRKRICRTDDKTQEY